MSLLFVVLLFNLSTKMDRCLVVVELIDALIFCASFSQAHLTTAGLNGFQLQMYLSGPENLWDDF